MYFDGSDIGYVRDINAIGHTPSGDLLISPISDFTIVDTNNNSIKIREQDLAQFNAQSLGEVTAGTWDMYFDGSDVGLTEDGEDIYGVSIDSATGDIYITVQGAFSVGSVGGDGDDIFRCKPISLGENTACNFGDVMYFDGDAHRFWSKNFVALSIVP